MFPRGEFFFFLLNGSKCSSVRGGREWALLSLLHDEEGFRVGEGFSGATSPVSPS